MALANMYGGFNIPIGPNLLGTRGLLAVRSTTMDAANEAVHFIGRAVTSDRGSHTLNTSGSIGWRTGGSTFASGTTVVKVGVGSVDAATGPAARAVNVADVITSDVVASFTGGAGGITTNAWQTSTPTSGSKVIANGDLVAITIQMTARGGADSVLASTMNAGGALHRPIVTDFTGGTYSVPVALPNAIIAFADGAYAWIEGSDIFSTLTTRTWNSGSATKEYGQLYNFPFPLRIVGAYGWIDPDADCDVVLYSDPLGTPVAEKTVSIDANITSSANGRYFEEFFPTAYDYAAGQKYRSCV
jgi:hypothetical protein